MNLCYLSSIIPSINIIRDSEFNGLGMATSQYTEHEMILSFLQDDRFITEILNNKNITAIITDEITYKNNSFPDNIGIIISENPKYSFYELHNILAERNFYWQQFSNIISDSSTISQHAILADNSITIGENCIIEPGVIIHPGCIIGSNVIIRSGSIIGSNGFQFLNHDNAVLQVKTAGRVVIKDYVEIQHNCCVDRGVLGGDTIINEHVKVDNFVHIAHDDYIGERTFITAGVKLAGRVVIGKDCWIGVNATITNGIKIGDNAKITLGSVVTRSVPADSIVSGNFAIDHKKFIEFIKSIR